MVSAGADASADAATSGEADDVDADVAGAAARVGRACAPVGTDSVAASSTATAPAIRPARPYGVRRVREIELMTTPSFSRFRAITLLTIHAPARIQGVAPQSPAK
ncbi:hypothetical protein GCM10009803_12880 [Microbacterium ginsengiterrae]